MQCPHCHSDNIVKWGKKNGKQRFRCKDCGHTFILRKSDVINTALSLHSKGLSVWKIQEFIRNTLKVRVSQAEIWKWIISAKRTICSNINLKLNYNCVYTTEDFLDFLTYIAITKDFATNGLKTYRLLREKAPSADTLLYHLRKLSIEEILTQFDLVFDKLLEDAKRKGKFRNPVDVAIDIHDWLYYGEWDDYVIGTKPERGTHKAYKFMTICIVENGKRFHLKALPLKEFKDRYKVFEELLKHAMSRIKIKRVYLDRHFYDMEYIRILKKLGLKFIIQASRSSTIRKILDENKDKDVIVVRNYQMWRKRKPPGKEIVNLFIVPSRVNNDKVCFVTNLPVNEKNAVGYAELFRRRWGIETAYRVSKDFRAKTTSKNISVRLFYFLFSLCLYNLWILVNIALSLTFSFDPFDSEKPTITAKTVGFLVFQFQIDYG